MACTTSCRSVRSRRCRTLRMWAPCSRRTTRRRSTTLGPSEAINSCTATSARAWASRSRARLVLLSCSNRLRLSSSAAATRSSGSRRASPVWRDAFKTCRCTLQPKHIESSKSNMRFSLPPTSVEKALRRTTVRTLCASSRRRATTRTWAPSPKCVDATHA